MKALLTILLLVLSNAFMTIAWYGQLNFNFFKGKSLIVIIIISWLIAFLEYVIMIPANRIGFEGTGGPFSLIQLKVIQEVISLTVFAAFTILCFKNQTFTYNHLISAICLIAAVFFAYRK